MSLKTNQLVALLLCIGIATAACTDTETTSATTDDNITEVAIPAINYGVVATHPHDVTAFTEGLQMHEGKLYEKVPAPPSKCPRPVR